MNCGGNSMRVVIMAGGKGTRVASVDRTIPKPLLPVAGKPVLLHQIECLREQGMTDITLSIGHLGEQIEAYFKDGSQFGVSIRYIREDAPLGTAGALYYLRNTVLEDFFLINGDLVFDIDLRRMMEFHKSRGAAVTLFAHPNDHPYDSGLIVADSEGCVKGWLTKEDERTWYDNCVNAGVHILSAEVLERFDVLRKIDLDREVIRPLIPKGRVFAYRSPEYIKDMGTPERIQEVEADIQSSLVRKRCLTHRQKAIFLDRDGTINQYVGFLRDIEEFELIDGVAEAIRRINRSEYLTIVVSNQPVIARGEVTWEELREIHRKMQTLLGEKGAYIDDIFVCPHHPDSGFPGEIKQYKIVCDCRKPKPGLLRQAARKYNIDLTQSWMIGDSERDMEAGRSAGCRTVMLTDQVSLNDAVGQIGL